MALAEDIRQDALTVWREAECLSALTMERSFTALTAKDVRSRVGAVAGAVVEEAMLAAYISV
jgi:hypothetical protein